MIANSIDSKEAQIWWNPETREVLVCKFGDQRRRPTDDSGWCDVGASFTNWRKLPEQERYACLMEYVLDIHLLTGVPVEEIVREFAKIRQFYALGRQSHMMCRVLTKALLGRALELEAAPFDELMGVAA